MVFLACRDPVVGHRLVSIIAGPIIDGKDHVGSCPMSTRTRLHRRCRRGRILTSDVVRDLGSERGFTFDGGRDVVLKGFSGPIRVFEQSSTEH
jgi:class 3 adenylate cyclase